MSTAPIFSVSHAQQSAQTRTLFEIQELRQEISELRDMVERQQYQIRKMQQGQSNVNSRRPSGPIGAESNQNYIEQGYSNQPQAYGAQQQGYASQQSATRQPNSTLTYPYAAGSNTHSSSSSTESTSNLPGSSLPTSTLPDQPANAYDGSVNGNGSFQQYDSRAIEGALQGANKPIQEGVEERIITAPPVNRADGNAYPPVEERSIGNGDQPTSTFSTGVNPPVVNGSVLPATVESRLQEGAQVQQPYSQQTQSPQNTFPDQRVAVDSQVITPSNLPRSGGVIAIPDQAPPAQAQGAQQGIASALSESDYYNQGFGLMKLSKFDEAVTIFEQQLKAYPRGDSADDAHYWIAEAMYVSRDLDRAKIHLKTLIDDYPLSQRVPDAMLKKAYIDQQQGNQIEARILFQEIVNYHPKSDAAIAAKNRLAENN